jgi:hypothetical protein
MEQSTRVLRARHVVQAAIEAGAKAASADGEGEFRRGAGKHRKPTHLPNLVANTTDPQSRIMPTRKGFLQGYNAQLAVSAAGRARDRGRSRDRVPVGAAIHAVVRRGRSAVPARHR